MANFGGPVAPQGLHLARPNLALLLIHLVSIQRNEKKLRGEFPLEGRGPRPPKNFFFQFSFFCNVRSKNRVLGPQNFWGVGGPSPPGKIPPLTFSRFVGLRLGGLTTVPNLVRLGVTPGVLRAPKICQCLDIRSKYPAVSLI